jgi:hypothetical protein
MINGYMQTCSLCLHFRNLLIIYKSERLQLCLLRRIFFLQNNNFIFKIMFFDYFE